jgi:hypothetical protein
MLGEGMTAARIDGEGPLPCCRSLAMPSRRERSCCAFAQLELHDGHSCLAESQDRAARSRPAMKRHARIRG